MSREERGQDPTTPFYDRPTGGWGSLKSVLKHAAKDRIRLGVVETLRRQNKPGGHMCTSCAWAKPRRQRRASAGSGTPTSSFAWHTYAARLGWRSAHRWVSRSFVGSAGKPRCPQQ